MDIIDSHVHFIDLARGNYAWLQPQNAPLWPDKALIQRSVTQADLQLTGPLSIRGLVHIEAGFDNQQPWREIDYLEQTVSLPMRSVGGITLTEQKADYVLDQLQQYRSVVGVRHILDEQATRVLANTLAQRHMASLAARGLHFEAQLPATDTPGVDLLCEQLSRHSLRCIVNHAGFPPLPAQSRASAADDTLYQLWLANMAKLAAHELCAVKVSGFEMLSDKRTLDTQYISRVINDLVNMFSPARVMLAGNFPLCLLATTYRHTWQTYLQSCPAQYQQALCHDNAAQWYGFTPRLA